MSELVLHVPADRAWGTPNMSPFCGKLETYLRMSGTPYRAAAANPLKAPKGKVPFVELDGERIGDSQLIIERLEERLARTGKTPLDASLSPRERALGRSIRRMLEEGTYFTGVYLRWWTDGGFAHLQRELGRVMPAPFRLMLPVIRRKVKKALLAQGTARHSFDEIRAMAIADFRACADLLGEQPFLLGDAPHVVDCTLYPFLEGQLRFPNDSPVKQAIAGMPNLVAYRDRIRARWWADLDGGQAPGAVAA